MKIAFIVDEFPSLSQTFVLNQIIWLMKSGHDVRIFAENPVRGDIIHEDFNRYDLLGKTSYEEEPDGRFVRIIKGLGYIIKYGPRNFAAICNSINIFKYGRRAASLELLFFIVPYLQYGPFDMVHCQFGTLGLKGVLLKKIGALKCKVVTSIRGWDITLFLQKNPGIYDELFRKGDLFLPVSNSLMKRLVQAGCDGNKIEILYSGIDCSRFTFCEKRRAPEEPTKILTIARLVEKKGVRFAIEAVARLIAKGKKISYLVVGDGKLREELENLIHRLGAEADIKLLGWKTREEINLLFQDAHVLVAPSLTSADGDQEGIPNVIKEAMASGLPVLSTMHSGIPELVKDGITGFLVPERDIDSLAEFLEYLIDHPGKWPEMGRCGQKIVKEQYDMEKLNDKLVGIYKRLSET